MTKKVLVTNIPATYRIDLYNFLGEKGFTIFFYAYGSKRYEFCRFRGPLSFPWVKVNIFTLFWKLLLNNPAVVYCINASPYSLICGLYASLFRKKFTIWWAGTLLSEAGIAWYKKAFRKIIFRLAEGFVAYSEFASEYLKRFDVKPENIEVIGNVTLDPQRFLSRVESQRRIIVRGNSITILSVSNLIKRKNLSFLLDVFEKIKQKRPDARLVIVGEGPERSALADKIAALGTGDIELLGKVSPEDMYEIYAAADIFVHTASLDQWPQAVNEAIAAKLPVVISKYSGVPERLLSALNGPFILDLDKRSFSYAAVRLIASPDLRKDVAENNYKNLCSFWERVLQALVQ
jgi:glycosyltransferase involved in cell wall biosynthesis